MSLSTSPDTASPWPGILFKGLLLITTGSSAVLLGLISQTLHKQLTPRYEYRVEAINDLTFTSEMNRLGREGWEAVSARRASDGSRYSPTFSYEIIFKRKTTP